MLSSIASYGDRFHRNMDGPLSMTTSRSSRRGPWLPDEDNTLLQLVRTQGANNWVRISQQLQHRSPKQCRERYHQNLKPSLKHDPISAQEGEVIEQLVQEMGKRWAEIARRLGNRSDNAVKNWWNGSVNRRRRTPAQPTTGFKQVGTRLQPIPMNLPRQRGYATYSRTQLETVEHENDSLIDIQARHLASRHQAHPPIHDSGLHHRRTSFVSGTRMRYQVGNLVTSHPSTTNSGSSLPQVQTSELRPELPPLQAPSLYAPCKNRPSLGTERPPISPAPSEASQRQPPSLVSDNHSSYSISPRTVTTPHPGVPAPVEIGHPVWTDAQPSPHYPPPFTSHTTSHQGKQYGSYARVPNAAETRPRSSLSNEERSKDLRMDVSTLLQ